MNFVTRYSTHLWCTVTAAIAGVFGWFMHEALTADALQKDVTLLYMMTQFKAFFPELIFLLIFGGFGFFLMRASFLPSSESTFDVVDLVTSGGKADPMKLGYVVAVMVLSWGFFALVFKDKLTEWYVMVFAAALLTGKVGDTWIRKAYDSKAVPPPPKEVDPPPPPPKYAGG